MLATSVRLSALLAFLISAVGVMPLSTPDSGPTCWAAVALTTVATDADSEHGAALRRPTDSQPENALYLRDRAAHSSIMLQRTIIDG
jgi:hypothetical protein